MPSLGSGSAASEITTGPVPGSTWPTNQDVQDKIALSAPDGLTDALISDIDYLLAAVIAEIQSPIGLDGGGGTGRSFDTVTETRTFDGNGFYELRVGDIVPETDLTVVAWDAELTDVVLADPPHHGLGHNRIVRPQGAGALYGTSYLTPGIFPVGVQNIHVTATWGFAATIPQDVWEAVRCEVASRALVQGAVPLDGVGDQVRIGEYAINTSSGISVWEKSSPIAILRMNYQATVKRYRERGSWTRALLVRRMS